MEKGKNANVMYKNAHRSENYTCNFVIIRPLAWNIQMMRIITVLKLLQF